MEIRLGYLERSHRVQRSVSVTMRTPGDDEALAVGFLLSEGVVRSVDDIEGVAQCRENVVRVELTGSVTVDWDRLQRNFYTTSSCGVCGKSSLEALAAAGTEPLPRETFSLSPATIHSLPARLRAAQPGFESTGGLHAAALFGADGTLIALREDVGRHNAVDKVIGAEWRHRSPLLSSSLLLVSGRASFELVQKTVMARIPALAAVGAPSSLAVEVARRFGVTLVGFVRNDRFNVYHDEGRIRLAEEGRSER